MGNKRQQLVKSNCVTDTLTPVLPEKNSVPNARTGFPPAL